MCICLPADAPQGLRKGCGSASLHAIDAQSWASLRTYSDTPLYSGPFTFKFSWATTLPSAAKANISWTPLQASRLGFRAPDTRRQVRGDHEFCRDRFRNRELRAQQCVRGQPCESGRRRNRGQGGSLDQAADERVRVHLYPWIDME